MRREPWFLGITLGLCLATAGWGATFGRVVAIGGSASDLALDETRGVLYLANFTANRIEVMSLANNTIQTSINVAAQPSSLSLSPDGRFLVVAHYGNFQSPNTQTNALTVIDFQNQNSKQTFLLADPPLGVAFGLDGKALLVTTKAFLIFDPLTGVTITIQTIADMVAKILPTPAATYPPSVVAASVAVSADRLKIYGLTDTFQFRYNVTTKMLSGFNYTSTPAMGPRVVSVNSDGSYYLAGWGLWNPNGNLLAQFPDPAGLLSVGSHAIDSSRGVVYAQIPSQAATSATTTEPPVLMILDSDNLAVREKLQLQENLAGKSVLSSDGRTMYSISDSGLTVLPVGSLAQSPRLLSSQEDVVFRGSFCDRRVTTQQILLTDPSGNSTDFSLSADTAGITVSPAAGVTPAAVRITVDPTVFQNQKGTVTAQLQIKSALAVNIPSSVRILINTREPDQRGTFVNVPGKLVDLLADPTRDRFFILRQDKNQVLVYDGSSYNLLSTLRTGNTPTQMAITFDQRYLLVGNDNSQYANVFDLETLAAVSPILFPGGHYPRSLASSGRTVLAACRVAGPKHTIDRVDMYARTATEMPTLGIYENDINLNTVLAASPNGSSIMAAETDGTLLLYNANVDTFTVARKDYKSLTGPYAASSYDQFAVGSLLLNASLVQTRSFETGSGSPSGFAFVDQYAFRTSAPSSAAPGVIQRVNLSQAASINPTRMAEAPLLPVADSQPFTRTLAPLYNRNVIVNLTVSGFTVVAWNYDAAVIPPVINALVNAADGTKPVAPGGLVSIYGSALNPISIATKDIPLPTALGDSCLTVNGVPLSVLFVSPTQINAQLPFNLEGNVTMILHTPGGVSDNFNFTILPAAPSVFSVTLAGLNAPVPTIIRAANNELVTLSNPIHHGDTIVIYLTGMGRTNPPVDAGLPAPFDPLAVVLITPQVELGGVALPLNYAGMTPGQIGLYQINAFVPRWVPLGMTQTLKITQSGDSTSMSVRVVD